MNNTAKFKIKKQINGHYYFILVASNNETILKSEGYTSKQNCVIGINSVKTNATYDNRYERKISLKNMQYYFALKASNGEIIGSSEMYNSTHARENGISAVKRDAPNASILDLSL